MTGTTERRNRPVWLWCLVGSWSLLALARILLSTQIWHTTGDSLLAYLITSLQQDLFWLGGALLCVLVAHGRGPLLTSLVAFTQLALWLLFLLDLLEIAGHHERLLFSRLIEWWQLGPQVWWLELSSKQLTTPLLISVVLIVGLWFWQWQTLPRWKNLQRAPGLAAVGVIFIALSFFPSPYEHPLPSSYRHLFAVNAQSIESTRTPPVWSEPTLQCVAGDNRRLNAIVLLVPGLSWHHTDRLEPDYVVLPNLSRLMDQYAWWPNYLGHGTALGDQLKAMLTATDPWQSPIPESKLQRALPHQLADSGYRSAYLVDEIGAEATQIELQSLGFETVQIVANQDRPSVEPNAALLAATLAWISAQQAQTVPFLAMTQLPDLLLASGTKSSEATAGGAVDRAIDQFVATLRQIDFFVDGILIVASGHRAQTPLRSSERRQLGLTAAVRLPLAVIGDRYADHGRLDTISRARDFSTTFQRLMNAEVCTEAGAGDWFGEAPDCSFSLKTRPANHLLAVCGDGHASIVLAGPNTRIWESQLSSADQIVARIRDPFVRKP